MGRKLKRIAGFCLLIVAGAALLAYVADLAIFRYRVATNRNAYGSVTVNHYYAVLQKNGKTS
jgi:hypothetical protein